MYQGDWKSPLLFTRDPTYPPGPASVLPSLTSLTPLSNAHASPTSPPINGTISPPSKNVQFDLRPGVQRTASYHDPGYESDDSDSKIESLRPRRSRSRSRSRRRPSRRRSSSSHERRRTYIPPHPPLARNYPAAPTMHHYDSDATIDLPPRFDAQGRPIPPLNTQPIFPRIFNWREPFVNVAPVTPPQGYISDPEALTNPPHMNLHSWPQHRVPPQQPPPQQNRSAFPQAQAPEPTTTTTDFTSTADPKTVDKVEQFLNGIQDFVLHERDLWRQRKWDQVHDLRWFSS